VQLRPAWPRGHACRGAALEGMERLPEALEAFKAAQQLSPANPELVRHDQSAVLIRQYAVLLFCAHNRSSESSLWPVFLSILWLVFLRAGRNHLGHPANDCRAINERITAEAGGGAAGAAASAAAANAKEKPGTARNAVLQHDCRLYPS